MKKLQYLALVIFLLISMQSLAQKEEKKKVGGIRGGFHTASMVMDGHKPDTANSLNTFYVGYFRDNNFGKLLAIGTGLEYFQNGLSYQGDMKRVLHTLSVPVSLKVKIGPVFAQGGIAGNFKVAERILIAGEKNTPADDDKSKGFDAAAFVGAGVKIAFIIVEARYHWGLLEARPGMYNRYFQIGAGIAF